MHYLEQKMKQNTYIICESTTIIGLKTSKKFELEKC